MYSSIFRVIVEGSEVQADSKRALCELVEPVVVRYVHVGVAQGQIAGADVGRRDAESQHAVGACGDSADDVLSITHRDEAPSIRG